MGKTDPIIIPFYKEHIKPEPPTALLGFTNNNMFDGDLYDIELGNWDINDISKLPKEYKTIICTRCAYFSKHPYKFIYNCWRSLKKGGMLYVDWGLGDHWRFDDFKVGWVKGDEHEYGGKEEYKLWSTVWDFEFTHNKQCQDFMNEIAKLGYHDLQHAVFEEVPSILQLGVVRQYFDVEYEVLTTVKPYLQMYILLKCKKK